MEKFDNTKILIDVDDKLTDSITFKNVILITQVINYYKKFYLQPLLEHQFWDK